MSVLDSILLLLGNSTDKLLPYVLNLLFAAAALFVGILAAKMVQLVVVTVFKSISFDPLLKKLKFTDILERAEIKRTPSELLGDLSYWFAILVLVLALADFLKLPIDPLIDQVLNYVGVVFLAAVILGLGVFLSALISGIIYLVAANIGIGGAKTIARLMKYATVIFAFLLALEQLGIGPSLIVPSIGVIIGALGLAVAIAFGLGCKDIMADFVSNLIKGR